MRTLKIAADFMDSAMNNKRLNMGEVVGEKNEETTAYFVNALKIGNFWNSKQFSKGGPLEESYFLNFSKTFYFTLEYHMGLI